MAGFIAKKLFGEYLENKFGTEDPVFEEVPATRLDGTLSGKVEKRRKALPPGISDHDAKVLTKVKRRAYKLDSGLCNCCGLRFGWESIFGIIPVVGDVFGLLLSAMVIRTANQVEGGLPFTLKFRMCFLALIDALIGAIPVVGDIGDAVLKANNRNAIALENYLREKGKKNLRKSGLPIPDVDPSDPVAYDRTHQGSRPEHTTTQPRRQENMSTRRNDAVRPRPSEPAPARVRDDRRGASGGGLFGFGSKISRPADVEMAQTTNSPGRKPSRRH